MFCDIYRFGRYRLVRIRGAFLGIKFFLSERQVLAFYDFLLTFAAKRWLSAEKMGWFARKMAKSANVNQMIMQNGCKKVGRLLALREVKPPRLTEEAAREAIAMRASTDLSVPAIAGRLGFTSGAFRRVLGQYPDFGRAFAEAGEARRGEIVAAAKEAMLRRIKGYSYTERRKKYVRRSIGDGEDGDSALVLVEDVAINRHVEPSDRMIEFALVNYAPDEFGRGDGFECPSEGGKEGRCTAEEARRIADEILGGTTLKVSSKNR